MPDEDKPIARQALNADRRLKAARMRDAGFDWPEVAEKHGYASALEAYKDVIHGLRADRQEFEETADDRRHREERRLDALRRTLTEQLAVAEEADDSPGQVAKVAEQLRRLTREMALLYGLDAPKSVEVAGTTRYEIVGVDPESFS